MDRNVKQEHQNRDSGRAQERQDQSENRGQNQNRTESQNSNDGRNRPQGSNELADEKEYSKHPGSNPKNENQVNTEDMEKNWKEMKLTYREKYPHVTEEDINYNSGEFDDMTRRLAKRTNRTQEEVQSEIRGWND